MSGLRRRCRRRHGVGTFRRLRAFLLFLRATGARTESYVGTPCTSDHRVTRGGCAEHATGARTVSYSGIPFASDRRETRESGAEPATGARTESHDGITCA